MPGSGKTPHWQKVALNRFSEVTSHPDFGEDMMLIRHALGKANAITLDGYVQALMMKYEFPMYMYQFFKNYVILGEVEPEDILPPLFLKDEIAGKVYPSDNATNMAIAYQEHDDSSQTPKVYIEIGPDALKEDLKAFIEDYYPVIDASLREQYPDRKTSFRSKYTLKQQYAVIRAYKDKINDPRFNGEVYDAIQRQTNVSPDSIRKILEHYRKQKQYDIILP